MKRTDLILLMLNQHECFSPVQIQKAMFLIDRNLPDVFDEEKFSFSAYDYGPFDRQVYDDIEKLSLSGLAEIDTSGKYRKYKLTPRGKDLAIDMALGFTEYAKYFKDVADFVTNLSFAELVSSIYKKYPEMKKNSIFVGN